MRSLAEADFERLLHDVAAIGYEHVELAGLHGAQPERVRAWLDSAGLRAMGAHMPWERLTAELDAALDELGVLGCRYAIVPSLPRGLHDFDGVAVAARAFDDWAARCGHAGLGFGYHNHDYELRTRDATGVTLLERLVEASGEQVTFEVDVLWAVVGGADPADLLARHGGRIRILHVKDRGPGDGDAPFGEGSLPWRTLLPAARRAGVEWYVVEQDVPADPLRDVETSLRNLRERLAAAAG